MSDYNQSGTATQTLPDGGSSTTTPYPDGPLSNDTASSATKTRTQSTGGGAKPRSGRSTYPAGGPSVLIGQPDLPQAPGAVQQQQKETSSGFMILSVRHTKVRRGKRHSCSGFDQPEIINKKSTAVGRKAMDPSSSSVEGDEDYEDYESDDYDDEYEDEDEEEVAADNPDSQVAAALTALRQQNQLASAAGGIGGGAGPPIMVSAAVAGGGLQQSSYFPGGMPPMHHPQVQQIQQHASGIGTPVGEAVFPPPILYPGPGSTAGPVSAPSVVNGPSAGWVPPVGSAAPAVPTPAFVPPTYSNWVPPATAGPTATAAVTGSRPPVPVQGPVAVASPTTTQPPAVPSGNKTETDSPPPPPMTQAAASQEIGRKSIPNEPAPGPPSQQPLAAILQPASRFRKARIRETVEQWCGVRLISHDCRMKAVPAKILELQRTSKVEDVSDVGSKCPVCLGRDLLATPCACADENVAGRSCSSLSAAAAAKMEAARSAAVLWPHLFAFWSEGKRMVRQLPTPQQFAAATTMSSSAATGVVTEGHSGGASTVAVVGPGVEIHTPCNGLLTIQMSSSALFSVESRPPSSVGGLTSARPMGEDDFSLAATETAALSSAGGFQLQVIGTQQSTSNGFAGSDQHPQLQQPAESGPADELSTDGRAGGDILLTPPGSTSMSLSESTSAMAEAGSTGLPLGGVTGGNMGAQAGGLLSINAEAVTRAAGASSATGVCVGGQLLVRDGAGEQQSATATTCCEIPPHCSDQPAPPPTSPASGLPLDRHLIVASEASGLNQEVPNSESTTPRADVANSLAQGEATCLPGFTAHSVVGPPSYMPRSNTTSFTSAVMSRPIQVVQPASAVGSTNTTSVQNNNGLPPPQTSGAGPTDYHNLYPGHSHFPAILQAMAAQAALVESGGTSQALDNQHYSVSMANEYTDHRTNHHMHHPSLSVNSQSHHGTGGGPAAHPSALVIGVNMNSTGPTSPTDRLEARINNSLDVVRLALVTTFREELAAERSQLLTELAQLRMYERAFHVLQRHVSREVWEQHGLGGLLSSQGGVSVYSNAGDVKQMTGGSHVMHNYPHQQQQSQRMDPMTLDPLQHTLPPISSCSYCSTTLPQAAAGSATSASGATASTVATASLTTDYHPV